MFQAFIDDSGWDGRSPVFVLAGYVASEAQWESFTADWQAVLDLEEPKSIDFFKMVQAAQYEHRHSQFYGFSKQQVEDRLTKLVKVINKHVEHGIVSVVPIEPYARHFKGRFNPDAMDRPYFLSFFGIMTQLLALTKHRGQQDGIDFIFDTQGGESKSLLVSEYERFISLAPDELKRLAPVVPKFETEQRFKPLQAADLIAWHARRFYYQQARGIDPESDPSNVFLANMFLPKHDMLDIWNEARIKEAAETVARSSWQKQPKFHAGISMTLPDPSNPLNWRV